MTTTQASFPAGRPVADPGHGHGRLAGSGPGRILAPARRGHATAASPTTIPPGTPPNGAPARIDPPPADWGGGLPEDVKPSQIWGFSPEGKPKEWPMRFSVALWSVSLKSLKPGGYEFRVRTVDKNGFAQPEPRPSTNDPD